MVWDGRTVGRVKNFCGGNGNPLAPTLSSKADGRDSNGKDSDDSIVGALPSSLRRLSIAGAAGTESELEQLSRLNLAFQETFLKKRDRIALLRLLGQFYEIATGQVVKLVDQLHKPRLEETGWNGATWTNGCLQLTFLTDPRFAMGAEEEIARGTAMLRQEMNAARWVSSKGTLMQPLMAVIEWKGFRVLAMIRLPLGEHTLVIDAEHGLVDGELNEELASLTDGLWSDGPLAVFRSVEVHRVKKASGFGQRHWVRADAAETANGLYLVNVHDLVPKFPDLDDEDNLAFRVELVQSMGPMDLYSTESRQAFLRVLRDERLHALIEQLESSRGILELTPLDGQQWSDTLHAAGLNIAMLGAFAERCRLPHLREAAELEMLARTVKNLLRKRLREAILHFRQVQALRVEEELGLITVAFCNAVLQPDERLLREELLPAVEERFSYGGLTVQGVKQMGWEARLMALEHHCGLQVREQAWSHSGTIGVDDLAGFVPRCSLGFATEAEGVAGKLLPYGASLWLQGGKRASAARALLDIKEVELAASIAPRHHPIQVLIALEQMMAPSKKALPVTFAEKESSTNGAVERAAKVLLGRVEKHHGGHHPLALLIRSRLAHLVLSRRNDKERGIAAKLRKDAHELAVKMLGKQHELTVRLLFELAECLEAMEERRAESLECYLQVLSLLKGEKPDEEMRLKTQMAVSRIWQERGDLEAALSWTLLSVPLMKEADLEINLKRQADLSIQLSGIDGLAQEGLSILASDATSAAMMSESSLKRIQHALLCYEQVFEKRRQPSLSPEEGANGEEGELWLLRLARRIVFLGLLLGLGDAAVRPAIKAAIRLHQFSSTTPLDGGKEIRELLVKMVAGPSGPAELVAKTLHKFKEFRVGGRANDQGEGELRLLIELLTVVQAGPF